MSFNLHLLYSFIFILLEVLLNNILKNCLCLKNNGNKGFFPRFIAIFKLLFFLNISEHCQDYISLQLEKFLVKF